MNRVRVRELIRKEFIQLLREKRNLPLIIIAPFMMLMVFGYVVSTDVNDVKVGILDQSMTRESRMLTDSIDANRTFRITYFAGNADDLEDILLHRKVDMVIKIGPDFSEKIRKGDSAVIQVLVDGSMSNISAKAIAYLSSIINSYNQVLLKEIFHRRLEYGRIDARVRTWYNDNLESKNTFVPGIVAFLIMLVSLLFTSMAIIREKEAGTIEQLIVTPLKSYELILGKTIPYITIAIGQMIMVTIFAVLWFSVPFNGNFLVLFAGVCFYLISTMGIGLFISTVSGTQQQAMMTTFFFILPFLLLSGLIFPIANMPKIIQWFTLLNPLRYFIVIIRGVFLKGVGMSVLWPQFLGLAILGTIVFTGAVSFFRKRLD
ncbi:MAG TPA: ABC transporter permease [Desulfatiglandales bacterium]|nr:ABC transporter permease [Desulfatiglandales bacterium]